MSGGAAPTPDDAAAQRRVLFVDDDEGLRDYVSNVLTRMPGVEVVTAASGEDAMAVMQRDSFDVIVSDQRMGKIDGVQVLEAAAKLQEGAPRVLVTGYADLDLTEEAVNTGHVTRMLSKPFLPQDLTALVAPLLHERRAAEARASAFSRAVSAAAG